MLLQLQRDYGNRHVQRVVGHARDGATASGLMLDPMEAQHERAAERVADQVAGGTPPRRASGGPAIGHVPQVPARQRQHGMAGGRADDRVRRAIESARGGCQPLPEQVRDSVEAAVGTDLSRVRLHADARADQLTRLLGARAFTTGSEIFLRRGEYRPGSAAGRRLLAHELTHVAQQAGGAVGAGPVSGISGTGAIQRMKIDGLDTDAEKELAELLSRIRIMDTSETTTMRRAIKKELAGRDADSNVTSLLTALDAREQTLDRRRRNAASSQPAEPEQGARVPRRMAREQSPPPSRERNRGLASRDPAETKAEGPGPSGRGPDDEGNAAHRPDRPAAQVRRCAGWRPRH
jgi:hypothetical protein